RPRPRGAGPARLALFGHEFALKHLREVLADLLRDGARLVAAVEIVQDLLGSLPPPDRHPASVRAGPPGPSRKPLPDGADVRPPDPAFAAEIDDRHGAGRAVDRHRLPSPTAGPRAGPRREEQAETEGR